MIAISDKLRHQVMKLAEQYEKPEFITDDPVQFPRRFGYKCSQEIVGFIAAWLAYGNRKAILSTCEKLCKEMERLKNEFPEAYLIYMDVITADWNEKRDDAKKPASNLCDTIENIRATLKPNLKEALKHDKEEE